MMILTTLVISFTNPNQCDVLIVELENKVVDLESELEKTKLAEFETQESVMLMNDSVNSIKTENIKLKDQLKQLDEENRKATTTLEDVTFELDSLRVNCTITEEKLMLAETELKKVCQFTLWLVVIGFVHLHARLKNEP
jgi:chromosome segregation ATPase